MGGSDISGYMAQGSSAPSDTEKENHGLRFTNDDWNGSISNGIPFTIKWNETIDQDQGGLRLFNIQYPRDGVMAFELVSNLSDSLGNMSFVWTPSNLSENELYAFRVTRDLHEDPEWAISPPWKVSEKPKGFHWSNAVGIPIVVILGIYFICLTTCLMYRRRKKIKRERDREAEEQQQQQANERAEPSQNADRQQSVSSVTTGQTLATDHDLSKRGPPIILSEPRRTHCRGRERCRECGSVPRVRFRPDPEMEMVIGQAV